MGEQSRSPLLFGHQRVKREILTTIVAGRSPLLFGHQRDSGSSGTDGP